MCGKSCFRNITCDRDVEREKLYIFKNKTKNYAYLDQQKIFKLFDYCVINIFHSKLDSEMWYNFISNNARSLSVLYVGIRWDIKYRTLGHRHKLLSYDFTLVRNLEANIPKCRRDSIKLVALKCHERSHKIQVRELFRRLLIKDYELSNSHICGKHDVYVVC